MTTQPAYPAPFAVNGAPSQPLDPVRARVAACPQLSCSQQLPAASPFLPEAHAEHRGLHLLADTRGTGPRGPHPGDVLYWVACLGGACLLLIAATS